MIAKTPDALLFFDGNAAALALFGALESQLAENLGDFSVKVQKTQITFSNRRVFACASLPRRKGDGVLMLTFGLPYRLVSPRVFMAVEPYPNRWTHHVLLSDAGELDAELMGYLREAYDFSAAKR